ncbi:probable serine/threonine protein kinase IRE [Hibiscus syriacus]|uniref:probable serine/threonine protein kinase IRE n=1 Tax=Hibiscus syriacus TaxID=106335 RepID=UPI0019248A68|nr:probable serine/threonine protein kinase IRE [Hibiscus syriacus]
MLREKFIQNNLIIINSFSCRFLIHDPTRRLGATGATEVKAHAFFNGIKWDSLALQKAAFVPHPNSADDTSYFTSRFSRISSGILNENECGNSDNETHDSESDFGPEMDECGDLAKFDPSPLNLSLISFSFKKLSQLASINHDILVQSGKDSVKCSPSRSLRT